MKFWINSYDDNVHLVILSIFDPKMTFLAPYMTQDDLDMYTIEFRRKISIDP